MTPTRGQILMGILLAIICIWASIALVLLLRADVPAKRIVASPAVEIAGAGSEGIFKTWEGR